MAPQHPRFRLAPCVPTLELGKAGGTQGHPVPRHREPRGRERDEVGQGLVQRQSNSGPGTIKRDLFLGSGLSLLWGTEWKMYI